MIAASGPAAMFVLTTPSICLMAVTVTTPTFPGPRGIRRAAVMPGDPVYRRDRCQAMRVIRLMTTLFQAVLDGGETVRDVRLGEVGIEIGFAPPESHEIEDGPDRRRPHAAGSRGNPPPHVGGCDHGDQSVREPVSSDPGTARTCATAVRGSVMGATLPP